MDISANQMKSIAAFAALLCGVVYLGVKFISLHGTHATDFNYIWLSGKFLLSDQNPYSDAFGEFASASDLFKGTNPPTMFGYPFHWALPAMGLAELPLGAATTFWRACGIVAMVPSVLLIFLATRTFIPSLQLRDALIVLAYLLLMQATAIMLAIGQSGWIFLLGFSFILYGVASAETVFTVLGLVLVMLKPNTGIPLLATLAVFPRQWLAIAIAGLISILLALPVLSAYNLFDTMANISQNISRYDAFSFNNAASMTGIRNLVWEVARVDVNSVTLVGIASLAAIALTMALRRTMDPEPHIVMGALYVTLAIIMATVPLHTYDFVVVAPFVLLALRSQPAARWLILLPLVVFFRSDNLGNLTGFYGEEMFNFAGSLLNSIASILLLMGCLWFVFARANYGAVLPTQNPFKS